MLKIKINCKNCVYHSNDTCRLYFSRSTVVCRQNTNLCGPDAKFFIEKKPDRSQAQSAWSLTTPTPLLLLLQLDNN